MSFLKTALVYAAVFAAGAGTAYVLGGTEEEDGYQVVRQCGDLYVRESTTGLLAEVDDDFDVRPVPREGGLEACMRTRSIGDRIEDAYNVLTR